MADSSDVTQPFQPLDLIFSCNICHDSIRDIRGPMQDGKELGNIRKPVAKLWMTECAHLICAKHLEGGGMSRVTSVVPALTSCIAPPFHPAGQAPRAVCPVCVARQNNHALKQMFAIGGFSRGEYDPDIPHHFFQCPPVALDSKDGGMDALRFQFLGLVTYGIAIATKFRGLQAAHTLLKDQAEKSKLEKAKAETDIQTLTERITLMEEAERRYKAKQPEIEHYLHQFTLVKKELDRRNEDLRAMGYPPPPIDYTFSPSRLIEDDISNGRRTTSPTRLSRRGDRADPRTVDDSMPSVSSITLRGESSRTHTEDDLQRTDNKRQKLAEYNYEPQSIKSPSRKQPDRERSGIRLPPQSSVILDGRSNHFQTMPKPSQHNNQQPKFVGWGSDRGHVAQPTNTSRDRRESWGHVETGQHAEARLEDPPYMSGALDPGDQSISGSTAQSKPAKQLKRKVQPVDNIDDISRSNFNTSKRPHTGSYAYQQYDAEEHPEHNSRGLFREPQDSTGLYSREVQHSLPTRGSRADYDRKYLFEPVPTEHDLILLRHSDSMFSDKQTSVR
ncbi:hypothetical protein E4T39_05084 [Aureobasidium subglaciale]|nr:hypothetical protein E4T39_05084 [Aureobasidium subglaciale]